LERKVGHQALEIDFSVKALRRADAAQAGQTGRDAERCTRFSESKNRKAD